MGCEEEKQNYSTPASLAGEEADKASPSELDQSKKMSVCGQTVNNWLRKGHEQLQGLLPSLKALLLKTKSILHIDETWCWVRIVKDEFANGRYFKKYIWVLVNKIEKVVYFLYDNDGGDSRGTRPISDFLGSFIGGIQTDAYAVYRFFADVNEANERSLCRLMYVRSSNMLRISVKPRMPAGLSNRLGNYTQ